MTYIVQCLYYFTCNASYHDRCMWITISVLCILFVDSAMNLSKLFAGVDRKLESRMQ